MMEHSEIDLARLNRTVQRLADRQELADLVARYGRCVDDRDLDAVADMFTSDATFDSRSGPVAGRAAVLDYYRKQLLSYTVTYHYAHSQTVDFLDDDTATGVVQAHAELAIDGRGVQVALRYTDEYRREDGRWRFRSRRAQQLYGLPMDELGRSLGDETRKRWPGAEPGPADIPESLPTYRAFFGLD
jgi:uncharacterized protein (TIGR02246 family)